MPGRPQRELVPGTLRPSHRFDRERDSQQSGTGRPGLLRLACTQPGAEIRSPEAPIPGGIPGGRSSAACGPGGRGSQPTGCPGDGGQGARGPQPPPVHRQKKGIPVPDARRRGGGRPAPRRGARRDLYPLRPLPGGGNPARREHPHPHHLGILAKRTDATADDADSRVRLPRPSPCPHRHPEPGRGGLHQPHPAAPGSLQTRRGSRVADHPAQKRPARPAGFLSGPVRPRTARGQRQHRPHRPRLANPRVFPKCPPSFRTMAGTGGTGRNHGAQAFLLPLLPASARRPADRGNPSPGLFPPGNHPGRAQTLYPPQPGRGTAPGRQRQ